MMLNVNFLLCLKKTFFLWFVIWYNFSITYQKFTTFSSKTMELRAVSDFLLLKYFPLTTSFSRRMVSKPPTPFPKCHFFNYSKASSASFWMKQFSKSWYFWEILIITFISLTLEDALGALSFMDCLFIHSILPKAQRTLHCISLWTFGIFRFLRFCLHIFG